MESSAQKVARLLTALEDLARQEILSLRAGDVQRMLLTQQRIAPLVESLTGLAAAVDGDARSRIAVLVDQRRDTVRLLATALARRRDELRQMRSDLRRLAQVGPAYAGAASGGQQLRAMG